MTTVTHDEVGTPRITLTRSESHYEATLEVEGLDPQRETTAEERRAGVVSLDPPTVRVRALRSEYDSHRVLIAACQRAVTAAATSTLGDRGGPGGLLMTHFRVARGIRAALRLLEEDT